MSIVNIHMCELNPKFKDRFIIEFFTSHGEEADFQNEVVKSILELEEKFNRSGKIRVHVHQFDFDESK